MSTFYGNTSATIGKSTAINSTEDANNIPINDERKFRIAYVFAGHEFTRKEFMYYLETTMNMQQITDQRIAGSMMR